MAVQTRLYRLLEEVDVRKRQWDTIKRLAVSRQG